jgi:dihydrofolate reductase
MPPLVSLFISCTLDGYIARADGAIDWLTHIDDNDTDYGYQEFYDTIDGLLMGSTTFNLIRSLGSWPYDGKPTFVFTRRELPADNRDVHFLAGDPKRLVESGELSALRRLWLVGGSSLIATCIKNDIIDEYIITILPVLLGHGLRLFPSPVGEQWLAMTSCRTYDRGILQVRYLREKKETGFSS